LRVADLRGRIQIESTFLRWQLAFNRRIEYRRIWAVRHNITNSRMRRVFHRWATATGQRI
jgi:hypothetical protein